MNIELVLAGIIAAQGMLIVVQWVYFMHQTQKLVDKLMSRSYTEYTRAQEPLKPPSVKIDNDIADDLGELTVFQQ